ncbi:chemotaxis protein CheA [Marinomonas sp. IMCC 4694]|uniref:chemotaxis protein CheA n=1 Tax=Marinomonas sp. IMCC 4694 TaxID=2605432 RepID=UPI0011E865D8|nr:chemotaxis protein CheA [Marinomonas sp. IMCC 4694]TYL47566.1 chemotaxis protein CheA [Marinomonas sp. IMCC 4694]
MNDLLTVFREEAFEHIQNLEGALLILEDNPTDQQHINVAFRAMHTIKGSAGMVGFDHLSSFTHNLESLFEQVRAGSLILNSDLISLILSCQDHILGLLEDVTPSKEQASRSEFLTNELRQYLQQDETTNDAQTATTGDNATSITAQGEDDTESDKKRWLIQIKPASKTFQEGFDIMPILKELASLGDIDVKTTLNTHVNNDIIDVTLCYVELSIQLDTDVNLMSIEDVFIFVVDDWQIDITAQNNTANHSIIDTPDARTDDAEIETEMAIEQKPTSSGAIQAISQALATVKEASLANINTSNAGSSNTPRSKTHSEEQSIKIPVNKLDILMNLVGELVTAQVRLEQLASDIGHEDLLTVTEEMNRLSTDLRDTAFDIRMLPIGTTFARYKRLIRDLNKELNKEVVLETSGADTELDKMVLDKLGDPLIHLLRNSMDHGIESTADRLANGKSARGTIMLSASHSEGQILITISDDGAGLNTTRIEQKAIQKGLIPADHDLSEEKLHQLIFEAGFSTADTISGVSGRGVGMDVVRNFIDELRGRIRIDSVRGKGTQIRIFLPMTLAIIEGLMIRVGEEKFILPLSIVEECIETNGNTPTQENGTLLLQQRGQHFPCVRLREYFGIPSEKIMIEQTVVTNVGDGKFGIIIDEVIGQQQTVIKSLGKIYQNSVGIMGATITGDGGVAMILDVMELAEELKRHNQH